jgi:hypothetical protein
MFGRRVDHLADFGNLGRWEAADLGVLVDDLLVFRQVHTERLVGGDIALDPLDVGPRSRNTPFDLAAAPWSCSRSRLPAPGMSRSMMNLRRAIDDLPREMAIPDACRA